MNDIRKQIIIKEIEYWKQNRLLPEQYCNYLLTLYSEGEHETREHGKRKIWGKILSIFPTILLFLLSALFLFIYFNEMSFGLQIGIQMLIVTVSFFAVIFFAKKNQLYFTFYIILTLLLLFILTIDVADQFLRNVVFIIEVLVFAHCGVWYWLGKKFKLRFLEISGLVGIVLLLAFIVYKSFIS